MSFKVVFVSKVIFDLIEVSTGQQVLIKGAGTTPLGLIYHFQIFLLTAYFQNNNHFAHTEFAGAQMFYSILG